MGKLHAEAGPIAKRLLMLAALLAPAFTVAVMVAMLIAPAQQDWLEHGFTLGLFVERICGSWFVWIVARWTLRQRFNPLVQAIEPNIFLIFCSHVLWLALAWRLLQALGIGYGHPAYPIFFLTAPLQALVIGLSIAAVLRRLSPRALALLCGGRVPPPPDRSRRREAVNA